jgi:hypothetical protein
MSKITGDQPMITTRIKRRIVMRKLMIVLAALAIGFLLGDIVLGTDTFFYTSGNDYLGMHEEGQYSYIGGVADAFFLVGEQDKSPIGREFARCTKDMTIKQIHAIVEKYLKEHPEFRHAGMASIVLVAVGQATLPIFRK